MDGTIKRWFWFAFMFLFIPLTLTSLASLVILGSDTPELARGTQAFLTIATHEAADLLAKGDVDQSALRQDEAASIARSIAESTPNRGANIQLVDALISSGDIHSQLENQNLVAERYEEAVMILGQLARDGRFTTEVLTKIDDRTSNLHARLWRVDVESHLDNFSNYIQRGKPGDPNRVRDSGSAANEGRGDEEESKDESHEVTECLNSVATYECDDFSPMSALGPGGGEIIGLCSLIDELSGKVTIKARKHDGSTFGDRPYQIKESKIDDPCGPDTWHFDISDTEPTGIGTTELTFSFGSTWKSGQSYKHYCVTASTQPGDLDYDATNPLQLSWWYSGKSTVIRDCAP